MPMITEANPVAFTDPVPQEVDVVVIGAGVIGTATAYYLAGQGKKVFLAEKGRVAGEQSSRNWGWIRQQGRDPAELPIMMESNRLWRGLVAETGEKDLAFTESGCLYVAQDAQALAKYEEWHAVAVEHQLGTRMLSAQEVRELAPGMNAACAGGMLTPTDGRGEPFVAVPALARAAQARGVLIRENCAVRVVEREAGRISGVVTEDGPIKAGAVLLAGGAWSTYFASNAGFDLPQLTVRSTAGRTNVAIDGPEIPNISTSGLSIRRRDDGGYSIATGDMAEHYISPRSFKYFTRFLTLMRVGAKDIKLRVGPPSGYPGSWGSPSTWRGDEISPFERMRVLNPPPAEIVREQLTQRLPERMPYLKDVGIAEVWAGMIDVTPDAVPYLCEVPGNDGMFVATGMSGHGFGIGPGIGKVMADVIQGRDSGYDLNRFRFNRFTDGSPIVPGPY
jgi:glycine/D-amino acid oxidase-like deaminating enzyme